MKGRIVPPQNDQPTSTYPLWLVVLFTLWYAFSAIVHLLAANIQSTGTRSKGKIYPHPSVADLSEDEQKYYAEIEAFANKLLQERKDNNGDVLPRSRKEAAKIFGVGPRRVDQKLKEYVEYREKYGPERAVDYFVKNKRGPKSGRRLGDLQSAAIRFALLKRGRIVTVEGQKVINKIDYTLSDVYAFVKAICEEAQEKAPSRDTVRRTVEDIKAQKPTIYELGLWGREAVERKFVYKRANKVFHADARWQCDARDLPLYVLVDGKPCTVCLLIIYDDYTGYIVHWKLIPKVSWDTHGKPQRRNFTARDVATLFATAMYITGRQPDEFYTDNGTQFEAIRLLVSYLVNRQGKTVMMVNSRPRKPWGRGKVERALGRVNELVSRLPGKYDKKDRTSINPARRNAPSLEYVEQQFAEHFHHVNTRKQGRGGKPNRYDQYWGAISSPRPSFVRMMHLGVESKVQWSQLNHWSFHCLGEHYEPKLNPDGNNEEIYRLLLEAATSEHAVRVCALKLDVGWKVEVRLRMGDDERWIESVIKGSQDIAQETHAQDQRASLNTPERERRDLLSAAEQTIRAYVDTEPELNPATGEYMFPPAVNEGLETSAQAESSPEEHTPNSSQDDSVVLPASQTAAAKGGPQGRDEADPSRTPGDTKEKDKRTKRQTKPKASTPADQDNVPSNLDELPDIDALIDSYRQEQSRQKRRFE